MERSKVHFGHTVIQYAIERGRRQKTVAIGVDPIDGVRVRAPSDTPIARLDDIVHRKAKWIIDRQRRYEDLPPPPSPREFVNGETFRYLGRQYLLKLDRTDDDARVRLVEGRLVVPVNLRAGATNQVRERLVAWYRQRAQSRVPERVETLSAKLDLHPASALYRDQQKRWGSADARGNVRFNWRIIQAPAKLIDYVVAHELVHLAHPDHTRDFWATLGRAIPDYEARRERLRVVGPEFIW